MLKALYTKESGPNQKLLRFSSVSIPNFYAIDKNKYHSQIQLYLQEVEDLLIKHGDTIAVFIMEPIVSVWGMILSPKEYFQHVEELCKKRQVFLVFDECQTGFGRTGK